jgi:acetyl-CoA acetyltransferase
MEWRERSLTIKAQFEDPYGLPVPIGFFAMAMARHMYEFGTTREQIAEIAVAARQWAQLNPKAWKRDPLTLEDVMTSRLISDPIRRLDCCLITDGGGVAIITHADRARDAAKKSVRVLGAGESHRQWHIGQTPNLAETAAVISGREAFGMAGITPDDVDVLQAYDAFTITPLLAIEDLGFCKKGEGGAFVEGGRIAPGGDFPMNTSGGGLSYCHPGAFGMLVLIEAVRQVRGEAGERQVPDVRIGVAHGIGGLNSCAATAILAKD